MFIDSNVKKVWFTGDTHFGHKNVIQYCSRPFNDVQHMNECMITNWNDCIGEDDIVFHLGDFAFVKEPSKIIKQLNGKIYLIPGNHDKGILEESKSVFAPPLTLLTKFRVMDSITEVDIQVEDEKMRFVLCHYAMRVWNKSHYGAIHLYGHSHGTLPDYPESRSMDVGVDCHNYTPISLDDVLLAMYRKVFKPVDHHEDKTKTREEIIKKNDKSV